MNLLDLIIMLPIAWFAFRGFTRGLVREVFSLGGIILAVFITFKYMDSVAVLLMPLFDEQSDMVYLVSGVLLFVVILLLVHVCAVLIEKFLKALKLNPFNRILGSAFGGFKVAIVISGFLLLLAGFDTPNEETRNSSLSYPYVIYLAPAVYDCVALLYPGAGDFMTRIQHALEDSNPIQKLPMFNPSEN